DRELVTVECARRRPGGAVAFVVELAAVTGATEAGRLSRYEPYFAAARPLGPALLQEHGPVRLGGAADMRATARHDREARDVPEQAVVADIRGAPRNLTGFRIGKERRNDELAFREGADRAEVDRLHSSAEKRRQHRHADRRQRDAEGDDAPEAERRALEQAATREALPVHGAMGHRFRLRRLGARGAAVAAHPRESAQEGDRAAERRDHQWADDQPDEQDCNADGKADRPDLPLFVLDFRHL